MARGLLEIQESYVQLDGRGWIRAGLALALVAMAAFSAFEAYLLVYSNATGVVSALVAAALVLVPLFPLREDVQFASQSWRDICRPS